MTSSPTATTPSRLGARTSGRGSVQGRDGRRSNGSSKAADELTPTA